MSYIKPFPPADSDVIFTDADGKDYTWGEHRRMSAMLDDLERNDPVVLQARQHLDEVLEKHGILVDVGPVILVCEFCGEEEIRHHKQDCPDYFKDLPITRTAGGYEFLDENFMHMHYTSVCATDEEAYDYFRIVEVMFATPPHVKFVKRRELNSGEYNILPVHYDHETKSVIYG